MKAEGLLVITWYRSQREKGSREETRESGCDHKGLRRGRYIENADRCVPIF